MSIAADAIARDTAAMQALLEKQRAAFTAELPVSAAVRKDRLQRALKLVLEHKDGFVKALSDDFGKAADDKPPRCSEGGDKGSSSLLLNLSCILLTRSSFEGDSREDSDDNVEPMDNKWKIL